MARETSYQRQCAWCGKNFEATREDATFHSQACKQAYWRWRHGVNLELARIKISFEKVMEYSRHEETCDEAWEALIACQAELGFILARDEVGTKKFHS